MHSYGAMGTLEHAEYVETETADAMITSGLLAGRVRGRVIVDVNR